MYQKESYYLNMYIENANLKIENEKLNQKLKNVYQILKKFQTFLNNLK